MAERRNCNFCGNSIEPGTGRMYVRVDGTVFYFDRHKCFANFVGLKRIPQDTKWSGLSRTASRWKDRPPKQKSSAAKVYAPRRAPSRMKQAEETAEAEAEGAEAPAEGGEAPVEEDKGKEQE